MSPFLAGPGLGVFINERTLSDVLDCSPMAVWLLLSVQLNQVLCVNLYLVINEAVLKPPNPFMPVAYHLVNYQSNTLWLQPPEAKTSNRTMFICPQDVSLPFCKWLIHLRPCRHSKSTSPQHFEKSSPGSRKQGEEYWYRDGIFTKTDAD